MGNQLNEGNEIIENKLIEENNEYIKYGIKKRRRKNK